MPIPDFSALLSAVAKIGSKPLYARGETIGYIAPGQNGCQGVVTLFPRQTYDIPPHEWYVDDFYGRKVTLTQYCLGRNQRPPWTTVNANTGVITAPNPVAGQPPVTYNPPSAVTPGSGYTANVPAGEQIQNAVKNPLVLIAAGAAVLGLVVLTSR